MGEPSDIAGVVSYLASRDARFVTGNQSIHIDSHPLLKMRSTAQVKRCGPSYLSWHLELTVT